MKKGFKYIIYSWLSVPLFYGVWLLIRIFVFDYFTIPTESMYPTLQPGDKVIVNKFLMGSRIYKDFDFNTKGIELKSCRTKGLRTLKLNDIVVFNFPHHEGKISFVINNVFCKRIVALPGDSLSIVNGRYVNNNYENVLGLDIPQKQLSLIPDSLINGSVLTTMPHEWHLGWTIRNFGPLYIPRKGDIINITPADASVYKLLLEWETGMKVTWDWDAGKVWIGNRPLICHRFQHNYYFMAGDNVTDSNDSRYWGLVPEEYIIGVVSKIIRKKWNILF